MNASLLRGRLLVRIQSGSPFFLSQAKPGVELAAPIDFAHLMAYAFVTTFF